MTSQTSWQLSFSVPRWWALLSEHLLNHFLTEFKYIRDVSSDSYSFLFKLSYFNARNRKSIGTRLQRRRKTPEGINQNDNRVYLNTQKWHQICTKHRNRRVFFSFSRQIIALSVIFLKCFIHLDIIIWKLRLPEN